MRTLNFILAMLAVLSAAACSRGGSGVGDLSLTTLPVGIIGGLSPNDTVLRSTALLFFYNPATHVAVRCTGTVVAPDLILTAAHCFVPADRPPRGMSFQKFIFFGPTVNMYGAEAVQGIRFSESDYLLHPAYDHLSLKSDLALVHVHHSLPANVVPLRILKDLRALRNAAQPVTIAGYGATVANDLSMSSISLRMLTTTPSPVVSRFEPNAQGVNVGADRGSAEGDSGGPALLTVAGHTYVWGIDSFVTATQQTEFYTVIARSMTWLQTAARSLGSTSSL